MQTSSRSQPRRPAALSFRAAPTWGTDERLLVRPDGVLAYDDRGSGPLVVMVPGLGDLRQQYRFLAPRLVEAGYRVVTIDLRGHGGSSTAWPDYGSEAAGADLLVLIEHLDAGPATLIGNSFGAAPAVWAASEHPEAVTGLVLIGPFVRVPRIGVVTHVLMRALFSGPWRVRAWSWYYGTLFPSRKPDDFTNYRQRLRANLAEPGRFAAVRAMIFRDDSATEQRLDEVEKPTLVVMGGRDPDFPDPAAEARWVAERLGGEAVDIEGAGHYPHVEMPERTIPAILDFLERNRGD